MVWIYLLSSKLASPYYKFIRNKQTKKLWSNYKNLLKRNSDKTYVSEISVLNVCSPNETQASHLSLNFMSA